MRMKMSCQDILRMILIVVWQTIGADLSQSPNASETEARLGLSMQGPARQGSLWP